jgi:hypothetical protein
VLLVPLKSWLLPGWWSLLLLVVVYLGHAQQLATPPVLPRSDVALDSGVVPPLAIDSQGWLLLDRAIQTDLDGAVHKLYNFKFDQADKQVRSPQHPLAYSCSAWVRRHYPH